MKQLSKMDTHAVSGGHPIVVGALWAYRIYKTSRAVNVAVKAVGVGTVAAGAEYGKKTIEDKLSGN